LESNKIHVKRNEWTPAEKLIDGKMIVTHVTTKLNSGHYTCTIQWKGDGPNLVFNINYKKRLFPG